MHKVVRILQRGLARGLLVYVLEYQSEQGILMRVRGRGWFIPRTNVLAPVVSIKSDAIRLQTLKSRPELITGLNVGRPAELPPGSKSWGGKL